MGAAILIDESKGKCDAIIRKARNQLILKPFDDRSGIFRQIVVVISTQLRQISAFSSDQRIRVAFVAR